MSILYIAGNNNNYITTATLSPNPTGTGEYPATNVKNGIPSIPWVGSGTAVNYPWLIADLGSSKQCNFMSFHCHNTSTVGTPGAGNYPKGAYSDTSTSGPWTNFTIFDAATEDTSYPGYYYYFSSPPTPQQYWRLAFYYAVAVSEMVIGTWVVGNASTLLTNQQYGWKVTYSQPKHEYYSSIGHPYIKKETINPQRVLDMSFIVSPDNVADVTTWRDDVFALTKGGEEPLIIVPDDSADVVIHGRIDSEWSYSIHGGDYYRYNIRVVEDPSYVGYEER